jgi:hypothetical protein
VTTVLYIVLGVLVVGVVALQVWIARSTARSAGDRGGLVRTVRIVNIALLVAALGLIVYALVRG